MSGQTGTGGNDFRGNNNLDDRDLNNLNLNLNKNHNPTSGSGGGSNSNSNNNVPIMLGHGGGAGGGQGHAGSGGGKIVRHGHGNTGPGGSGGGGHNPHGPGHGLIGTGTGAGQTAQGQIGPPPGPPPGPGPGQSQGQGGGPPDISRLSHPELVQRVRKLEVDLIKLASDHNHMIREANHRIQAQSSEMSTLQGSTKRLEEDNTELRDLCCFLDDDRQKGRKLAREWQRFGRYTASVMRQEVAAYQSKLRDLDTRQQQLVSDNMELKELCLYLDEERNQNSCSQCGAPARRDDGDGSSSSTNPGEEYAPNIPPDSDVLETHASSNLNSNNSQDNLSDRDDGSHGVLNGKIFEYVKRLERRVNELEKQDSIACPESVLNALQVLQVCQGLDDHDIGDQEKALVRQMCNVVWKKLEDNPKL